MSVVNEQLLKPSGKIYLKIWPYLMFQKILRTDSIKVYKVPQIKVFSESMFKVNLKDESNVLSLVGNVKCNRTAAYVPIDHC